MFNEPTFNDTNIFVYASLPEVPQHKASAGLLAHASDEETTFCIAPQVLSEYFSVVTNPRRVTAPIEAELALSVIEYILDAPGIYLLEPPGDLVRQWVKVARKRSLSKGEVFDAQLAVIMLANNVRTIYTYDVKGFSRFEGLNVRCPE